MFRVIISSITLGIQTWYSAYTSTHCNYSAMIYPQNDVTLIKQLLNFNLSNKVVFFFFWGGGVDIHSKFILQYSEYYLNTKFN
jgi:hypothetical protein